MLRDIEQLKKICDVYRTNPKLLLIPSKSMKAQVLKTLADYGVNMLNLNIKTIKELTYSIAETKIKNKNLTVLDFRETIDVMTDLLKELQVNGSLNFFNRIEITFGICKAIAKTTLELLDNGYLRTHVDLSKIENDKKRSDLELIISTYNSWKSANKCIDHSNIAEIALDALEESTKIYDAVYALEACEFSYLEEQVFNKIKGRINKEETYTESDCSYQLNITAQKVRLFRAYGDYNEAKEVLRTIFQEKIPFDNVLIVSPYAEKYSQLFYQLIQQYTYDNDALKNQKVFPVSFGTGLPLLLSSPAKLLMLLLEWVGSGYRSHELINVFSSDMFNIKKDQKDENGDLLDEDKLFGKLHVINVIKKSGLTWQRRSYLPCLEKYLCFVKEHDKENTKRTMATAWLIEFINEVSKQIPEADDASTVNIEVLLNSLKIIIDKYSRVFSAFDNLGLRVVQNELNTSIKSRHANLIEAVEIIKDHMRDINIMCESPAPGRMHFTTYRQAAWIRRKYVFVIGLGADNFPGMAMEDPLLLDNERMSPLLKSTDRINKNIRTMYAFIENVTDVLTCSYSNFDTVELRDSYPSTMYHQLNEIYKEDESCIGFVLDSQEHFVDENDYWIYNSIKNSTTVNDDNIDNIKERADEPMWQSVDQMAEQALSATSIVDYLKCQYSYFLKHVLHLNEITTDEFDALGWLSAIEMGNIYHKIFENFTLYTIDNPDILLNKEAAVKYIKSVAEIEIAKFEEELPTASDFHTKRQRDEIFKNIELFVEYEVEEAPQKKAERVEMPFGEETPVFIDLGEGRKIKAVGKIDRINRMKDGSIEIVDYKTGSTWAYTNLKDPCEVGIDEANCQQAVYYLALKEIANDNPDLKGLGCIKNMTYRFVTEKGNYDTISLEPQSNSEEVYKKAFLEVFKEIEKGVFLPKKGTININNNDDGQVNCKYCGFNNTCKYAYENEE